MKADRAGRIMMREAGSIALFQYWNKLRNGRRAPTRNEIAPAEIKAYLADTFILGRERHRGAVFRLAGTRLCATYGRELKGFSFQSLWRREDQRIVTSVADAAFTLKSVALLAVTGVSRSCRESDFELLLLPLEGGLESPRCMGALSAYRIPFWLGADPITETRVKEVRIVDPETELPLPTSRTEIGAPPMAPGADVLAHGDKTALGRRIRHLVVLEGGRRA